MVNFICDNRQVKSYLMKLIDIIVKNGGFIDENITILCRNGQFSLFGAQSLQQDKPCIFIPESCFIPVQEMSFSIKNEHIYIDKIPDSFTADQMQLAEIIFGLYRLTNKYQYYFNASVLQLYDHDSALFDFLTTGYRFDFQDGPEPYQSDTAHIQAFIKTRAFPDMRIEDQQKQQRIILPVIEYANHNRLALPNFYMDDWKGLGQSVQFIIAKALEGTDEIFIKYSTEDTRQLLFWQTYNEPGTVYVKSIPFAFSLGDDLHVKIHAGDQKLQEDLLYEEIKDLAFYLPMMNKPNSNRLALNFIYIPSIGRPNALRRVLRLALDDFTNDMDRQEDAILYAEQLVIRKNIEYYQEGLHKMEASAAPPKLAHVMSLLKEMHLMKIEKIKSYSFFDDAMSYTSKYF